MTDTKQFRFQIKAVEEDGSFTGFAAVYNNVDLGGDVIERGAFAKTIRDQTEIPVLWQHDSREPIGVGTLTDSEHGLQIRGQLVLESEVARTAYALLKKKALKGLSIGYDVVRQTMEQGVRHLKELKLWEVSLVTFPMNPEAQVTAVKTSDDLNAQVDKLCKTAQSIVMAIKAGVKVSPAILPELERAHKCMAALLKAGDGGRELSDADMKIIDDLRTTLKQAESRIVN